MGHDRGLAASPGGGYTIIVGSEGRYPIPLQQTAKRESSAWLRGFPSDSDAGSMGAWIASSENVFWRDLRELYAALGTKKGRATFAARPFVLPAAAYWTALTSFCVSGTTLISTRRLAALPSAVALEATG